MSDISLPALQALLTELIGAPGPPGQEDAVREILKLRLQQLKLPFRTDAKGNLLTWTGDSFPEKPAIVVTAHLDEIALLTTGLLFDGSLLVTPLGGAHPWKWGEGPVEILANRTLPGVLSFGSIHTAAPGSAAQQARDGKALTWGQTRVITGLLPGQLREAGVRPGTRIVLARSRRTLWSLGGGLLASYFLDDRADLAAWLLALAELREREWAKNILFAATAAEEVGGEGALYLLHRCQPEICIALEIGPTTPDAPFAVDPFPTVWVADTYAAMQPRDIALVEAAAEEAGLHLHHQALTRGGSDATCAAAKGLCARPVTLAFAAENSHGFEIMHQEAIPNLATLLVEYLTAVRSDGQ